MQSAEMYIEMGKFGIPAKHHEAIALIYAKVSITLFSSSDIFSHILWLKSYIIVLYVMFEWSSFVFYLICVSSSIL